MSVSASELTALSKEIADAISNVMNSIPEDATVAERKEHLKARKKLQRARSRVMQLQSEAAARELNGLASKVSKAAVDAERRVVENTLAALKEMADDVVDHTASVVTDIEEFLKEFVEEPAGLGEPVVVANPPVVEEPDIEDPVLIRRTTHGRRVWGHLVKEMQIALHAAGFDPQKIDMDFGGKTADALIAWHVAIEARNERSLTANEWKALVTKPVLTGKLPDLFDICAQVTAAFENHGFTHAVGDFDGAIATWGYHGFTLKFGHLQRVLEATETAQPGALASAFGSSEAAALKAMFAMSIEDQRTWGKETLLQGSKIKPSWKTGFHEIGSNPVCQKAQLDYSRSEFWEKRALPQANRLGLEDALSFGLMFDHAIQQGGFSETSLEAIEAEIAKDPSMPEDQKRRIIAKRAWSILKKSKWQSDVKSRRETFVAGTGRVHGSVYDLSFWGMAAAFDEKEEALGETFDTTTTPASFAGSSATATDFETWFTANVKPVAPNFEAREFLAMGASNAPGKKCEGLNSPPPRELWDNCIDLAKVLQEFRNRVGKPVRINSMYRNPEYNDCVGGKSGSQHKLFRAADIAVIGESNTVAWRDVLRSIRSSGVFRGGIGLYNSFVHVDTRGKNANW